MLLSDVAILEGIVLVDEFDCENRLEGIQRSAFLDATKLSAIAEQLEYGIGHRITRRRLLCRLFLTPSGRVFVLAAGQAANAVFRSSQMT